MPSDVELYQRTYSTLLRSRGETKLRILESSHIAIESSLHPLAGAEDLDLGAFLYATQRLPANIYQGRVVVMGQEEEQFAAVGLTLADWPTKEAPARRRQWHEGADGQWGVLLSSTSDVDDLVPTLVAYQIEWNKLRRKLNAIGWPRPQGLPGAAECARVLGGSVEDWERLQEAWGTAFARRLGEVAATNLSLRVRMLGGSQVSYARLTRRWWAPVAQTLDATTGLAAGAPIYFVSSNTHSLVNLLSGDARARESALVDWVERAGPRDLKDELDAFREERTAGSWNNFLYFLAREQAISEPGTQSRREAEAKSGIVHLNAESGLRVAAQVMPLAKLDASALDDRLGDVDGDALRASGAVIVNIDYPLGLAAYNILREITEDRDTLRGVYVLGKAATLNADVGDVMISSTIYDEHSRTTYWLDNAFDFDDIAPYLRFGSGLDNQRAVTVRSTFLQNRSYLDRYYREAYTVVEMEAGPYCDAVYEITEPDRYPAGEQVNFSKLPIDFGIVHYASDTPFTQARTLGARGMSYYGMDSTYATSIAILRRILRLEGVLAA
jgi:hypothetical protein